MVDLTDEEIYEICDALNTRAQHFRNLVATRKASKQTKFIWQKAADDLNRLSNKLLNSKP